jgi:hypothetical protein
MSGQSLTDSPDPEKKKLIKAFAGPAGFRPKSFDTRRGYAIITA